MCPVLACTRFNRSMERERERGGGGGGGAGGQADRQTDRQRAGRGKEGRESLFP